MELMWIPEIIVARLDFLYFLLDFNFMNIGFDLKINKKLHHVILDGWVHI